MGRLQKQIFFLLTVLILLGVRVQPARAQEPISATVEATLLPEMPRRLHFTLTASSSAGDLTEARLFFRPTGSSSRISEPIRFDPAPSVELEHEWQMQLNGIPPGAEIEYFWRLEDNAGNSIETPTQTMIALDPRFDWQHIEDEELSIAWYDGNQAWGQQMFETGKEALAQLEAYLGSEITHQVRLVAYSSNTDFRGAFPPQQDWIGGQAFPDLGVTVQIIGAGEEGWMTTVLFHELSHLVFHQAMEGALADAPSWLDEGLAMYNEPDSRGSELQVQQAAEANELLPFSQLQGNFGADGQTVGLAYAQSEMIVTHLIDDCGEDGFREFIQNLVDDMTVDRALESACGYDSQTLYLNWRQTLPNPPAPASEATPAIEPPDDSEPSGPSTETQPEERSLPTGLLLFLAGGLCFIALLVVAMIYVLIRLLRPQGGAT